MNRRTFFGVVCSAVVALFGRRAKAVEHAGSTVFGSIASVEIHPDDATLLLKTLPASHLVIEVEVDHVDMLRELRSPFKT